MPLMNGFRVLTTFVLVLTCHSLSWSADKLQYNRDIRPIFADLCFACHGPDSAARKADLRLDKRDVALERSSIVPGDFEKSELVRRVLSTDPEEMMPPPSTKKTITPKQRELLKRWITEGAEYEPHWSFIPPKRHELPAVKNEAWVRNPIDRFVLAKLEAAGLQPAPQADKRTLARRLSLDLTGLPPAPELVESFVNDHSPEATDNLIETLFKSPHWGEHRGRYWLDAARYADTHGIHFDNYREIWAYRDWVINAFNRNMPFDQFTIEQLAGDLLPEASLEQKIASGFNRCNMTTNEGGTIPEEYAVLYTRDRTETTSAVWMGLTTGCAVCHDHKFDPVSQKEFYEMAAFFNNTTQNPMDGNIKDTPPIITVPQPADRVRFAAIDREIFAAKQAIEQRKQAARPDFDKWLAAAKPEDFKAQASSTGLLLHMPAEEGTGDKVQTVIGGKVEETTLAKPVEWVDGLDGRKAMQIVQPGVAEWPKLADFNFDQPFACGAWVKLPANDAAGAIIARMADDVAYRGWDLWVQGRRIGMHLINRWPDNALKVVSQKQVPANEWHHVFVSYDGSKKAAGIQVYIDGELQPTNTEADNLRAATRTKAPLKLGQRNVGSPLTGFALNDLRIYDRAVPSHEVAILARLSKYVTILSKPAEQRTTQELDEFYAWWLPTQDQPLKDAIDLQQALEREYADIKARGTIAHVMNEKTEPAMAFVLFRGEYDKRRDQVNPNTPAILPAFPADAPRNRLGFARWLLQPDHPLTARVTVNRFWQEVFGQGLVRTSGDFGISGELPSHPELLDWLALEFRDQGWDVQKFFKLLVTSATYQQAAIATPEKREKDPHNRLFSRGPRFRMDAEMIRDYGLAASGLLSAKIGGPSVKPYQPDGVWEAVAMVESNTHDYRRDAGESLYRRSLYWFWKRAAPPASMDIFNATARETCTVRRERTNTPLQALVTLNDPQFVEAAKILAERAIKEAGSDDDARLAFITQRLIARNLRAEEAAIAKGSLAELLGYYRSKSDDAKALLTTGEKPVDVTLDPALVAAWTMLTNELMNLDEVLNK